MNGELVEVVVMRGVGRVTPEMIHFFVSPTTWKRGRHPDKWRFVIESCMQEQPVETHFQVSTHGSNTTRWYTSGAHPRIVPVPESTVSMLEIFHWMYHVRGEGYSTNQQDPGAIFRPCTKEPQVSVVYLAVSLFR